VRKRKIASLHFQFIFFLLGEKSLRIISDFFFVLLENTNFTKNTKNLPWIPRIHMKSLHYWFLVSCGIKGVKSSLRFISNLFCLIGRKIASHHFLLFLVLLENTKFTKNTKNLPRIPGTHMKSLHYWFLVVTLTSFTSLCRLYLFSSMKIQVLLLFHIFST
jgi:hypothetical protein